MKIGTLFCTVWLSILIRSLFERDCLIEDKCVLFVRNITLSIHMKLFV